MKNSNSIINLQNISFHYGDDYVLDDITFSIPKGAFVGLVGPNGSGKSTLIKIIFGLLKPQKGYVNIFGQKINKFHDWSKIGYVSQKANSFNSGFPASVFEVVSMGLTSKLGLFKFMKASHREAVLDALQLVGMKEYSSSNIGDLSGGQQQRVFIARALVSNPDILILDEPTVGVDANSTSDFYQLLGKLNKDNGITLLLVTHDIGTITDKVTHVACLNKSLHFHGETEEFEQFNDRELSGFYGHHVHVLNHDHGHGGV
ncbi:metal ABC transporter ATP-binding protein [Pseudalkalibacillus hwajinpoensis]|uniref:Metal ABC transporter ATP-binding protein n=1 Tax=Guptibacillus hwajinpoensis TaxID=208199 RepID=A0A4V5PYH9_9BACL|nr:metal ABC transporter ATP-binding protein [Pseudalkalibacillus hwajinpoensis]TKD70148.1 metal ABC transporter ATP-binding protein [Pseudalkalibacillus hwajinpoensis]